VWALLEGQFSYGIIPLDMRNVSWQPAGAASSLPWLLITAVFGVIYLFVYTRHVDWREPRRVVALTGFTLVLFMLYSKGYSPQWLGWLLAFVAMLLPNLRGAFYAVVASLMNLVEANVYFTIVPEEHWLLGLTVGVRTFIMVMLAIEFLLEINPHWLSPAIERARRWVVGGLAAGLLVAGVLAGVRFVGAYFDVRYQLSPYQGVIGALSEVDSDDAALILTSYNHRAYDWLYPYLRRRLVFYMLDDYAPPGESIDLRTTDTLRRIAGEHREWWLFDSDPTWQSESEQIATGWLETNATLVDVQDLDGGRLYHFRLNQ
jgi:hypothetical protein